MNLIILIGKTCSGKSRIKKELLKLGYKSLVTYTTRPMRNKEKNGIDYHFISDEKFEELKDKNFFFETTSYKVANGDIWKYGTSVDSLNSVEKIVILNPDGVKKIRELKENTNKVFWLDATKETLWCRLHNRGDSQEEAERRMKADDEDFLNINQYVDYMINTDELKPKDIAEIIDYLYLSRNGV